MPGIDVSQWQGQVDWDKAGKKVSFAFIKASEGLYNDAQFKRNWAEAKRVGIQRGAYLFYRCNVDPGQQARTMISALAGDYGELPLVVDLEDPNIVGACSAAQVADLRWCLDILERFSGRRPIIYTARWWCDPALGNAQWLSAYDLWVANYVGSPSTPPVMPAAWQYKTWKYFQWSNSGDGAEYGAQSATIDLDIAADEVPVTPVYPPISFKASQSSIMAGQSTNLIWSVEQVEGVWLDGRGVAGVASLSVSPATTTTYTLRVKFRDMTSDTRTVTVTVTPKPEPSPLAKVKIGYNVLGNGAAMGGAWNEGARIFLVIDNTQAANALAAQPDTIVIYRQWWNHVPSPDELVNALHPNRLDPRIIRTFLNEREGLPGGVQNIQLGSSIELNALGKLKALNPAIIGAVGTFSTGCPDFTRQDICDAVRECYAEAYNTGFAWWDQHTYSPDPTWIYRGVNAVQGLVADAGLVQTIERGKVGRSDNIATWVDMKPAALASPVALMNTQTLAFSDNPNYQSWFERRWEFLFTRCGFDPGSQSRIISGETGVDQMGRGGFLACGMTADQVVSWCKRFQQISAAPVVVGGGSYPSPFAGAAIFQLGDPSTDKGHWGGYEMGGYTAAIKAAGVYA